MRNPTSEELVERSRSRIRCRVSSIIYTHPAMVSTRTMSNVSEGGDASTSSGSGLPVKSNAPKPARLSSDKSPVDLALDPHADKVEPNLQYLPVEIFEKIVSNLTHRNIGYLRLVSRRMDVICGGVLNFKFQRLQTLMLTRFQTIKSKMPRRESARRTHPLACEADIVETLHMRLTLLQMTFGKHIERKHCCFFAGEILDECYRIINYINVTQKLSRPYKVTDELFDLSTMAMEYFKEHIEPSLPEIAYFNSSDFLEFTGSTYGGTSSNFLSPIEDTPTPSQSPNRAVKALAAPQGASTNTMLKNSFRRLKQEVKRNHNHLTILRRDLRTCKSKNAEQQKQLLDYSKRLDDNEKKNEETSRKFSTFLQELNKCKTELQYWRSKSPAIPPNCNGCGRAIYQAGNEDLAVLNNEGILPEGWPDVNVALPEVAPAVSVEDVADGDSMPPPKKPDETKESKAVLAGLKTLSSKRKFEDISVGSQEAGKSDELKAKEPKTGNAKKMKMTGVPKADNIPSTSNANEEGVTLRRILKPRGKPSKY